MLCTTANLETHSSKQTLPLAFCKYQYMISSHRISVATTGCGSATEFEPSGPRATHSLRLPKQLQSVSRCENAVSSDDIADARLAVNASLCIQAYLNRSTKVWYTQGLCIFTRLNQLEMLRQYCNFTVHP